MSGQDSNYISLQGVITAFDGQLLQAVGDSEVFDVVVDEQQVRVVSALGSIAEIEVGREIQLFTKKNKPMVLIYPPRYTPDVLVISTEEIGEVQLLRLDEQYISSDKRLKLMLDDSIRIESLAGEKVDLAKIVHKELLVFYRFTTRSMPAQTTPNLVIVLE